MARRIAIGEVAVDMCTEWDAWTADERRQTLRLAVHEIGRLRRRRPRAPQRRALRLLREFLTPDQQACLRRNRSFCATGSAGGRYRFNPYVGRVWRVERHGTRDFARAALCIHDAQEELPPADVTLAQLLFVTTDEPGFLATANATVYDQMWNGEYLRRMRRRRVAA